MKILLLEDDQMLAETIQEELEENHYECLIARTSADALDRSYEQKFDLYLLDINVPGIKGTTLLKELRASGDTTPAIFITSQGEESSVLEGYQSGADDYIRKPFTLAEMLVRIKALLRRVYGDREGVFEIGKGILFHLHSLELSVDGEIQHLPKLERVLLAFFCKNRGRVLSKDEIIQEVWADRYPSDTVIRVHIKNIKKLIGAEYIKNIKGIGYRFEKL